VTRVPSFRSVTGAEGTSLNRASVQLYAKNERLQMENKNLRTENEQLRGIFDDAIDQFNRLKKKVGKLSGELEEEKESPKKKKTEGNTDIIHKTTVLYP